MNKDFTDNYINQVKLVSDRIKRFLDRGDQVNKEDIHVLLKLIDSFNQNKRLLDKTKSKKAKGGQGDRL